MIRARAALRRDCGRGRACHEQSRRGAAEQVLRDWLAALPSLDFDRLSRNAQVDYLFIAADVGDGDRARRHEARSPIRRARPTRRASRAGPRPRRADPGPRDEMIPYTPEQLIALAKKEFAWCEAGDEEGVARRWDSATTGRRRSRRSRDTPSARRAAADDHGPAVRGGRLPARERPDHRAGRSPPSRCT